MRAPALQLWWDREPDGAEGLTRRLDGARGVRVAVILEGRDLISALLIFESAAMRDAYAAWAPKHLLTPAGRAPTSLERLDSQWIHGGLSVPCPCSGCARPCATNRERPEKPVTEGHETLDLRSVDRR